MFSFPVGSPGLSGKETDVCSDLVHVLKGTRFDVIAKERSEEGRKEGSCALDADFLLRGSTPLLSNSCGIGSPSACCLCWRTLVLTLATLVLCASRISVAKLLWKRIVLKSGLLYISPSASETMSFELAEPRLENRALEGPLGHGRAIPGLVSSKIVKSLYLRRVSLRVLHFNFRVASLVSNLETSLYGWELNIVGSGILGSMVERLFLSHILSNQQQRTDVKASDFDYLKYTNV